MLLLLSFCSEDALVSVFCLLALVGDATQSLSASAPSSGLRGAEICRTVQTVTLTSRQGVWLARHRTVKPKGSSRGNGDGAGRYGLGERRGERNAVFTVHLQVWGRQSVHLYLSYCIITTISEVLRISVGC